MTTFKLDDEKSMDVLIEEFLYLAGFADAEQMFNTFDSGIMRESTMFKICAYYDKQYGTTYVKQVEDLLGRKMNPKGGWVD